MKTSLAEYRAILAAYLRPQSPRVAALVALLLTSTGLQLANPQILRRFIDRAVAGSPLDALLAIAVLFLLVALLAQGVQVAATYLGEQVGWSATNALRADLALHALRLDLPFHNTHTPGEMIERIDGDITALSTFFSQFVVSILGSSLLLGGVLVLLCREDLRVGGAVTLFVVFALAVLTRGHGFAVSHVTAEREASAGTFGFIEERLAGLDDLRANGAGAYVMRRFHDATRTLVWSATRASAMSAALWVFATALFTLTYLLVLALGAYLYARGEVTIGTVYLFFQYTQILRRPLELITNQLREFQRAGAGIKRAGELLRLESAITDPPHPRPLPSGPLSVELDRLSFAYADGEPVLRDLSLRLAPGRVLGVLGRTGSGKTTLSRLLLRLYDPTAGSIRLGGAELRDARLADLRCRVGIVTQDVQLFEASVRDNLTLFDAAVPDERILTVLADLGLLDWFWSLPHGLETELASAGAGLSAGEAQLLAFARVFLTDPGLVILDEASSRLDPATERLIERAVEKLLAKRTGIVIAHRLGTVQRVDEILILKRGEVCEHGPREALARDPRSRFASLLRTGLETGGFGEAPRTTEVTR